MHTYNVVVYNLLVIFFLMDSKFVCCSNCYTGKVSDIRGRQGTVVLFMIILHHKCI